MWATASAATITSKCRIQASSVLYTGGVHWGEILFGDFPCEGGRGDLFVPGRLVLGVHAAVC